MVLGTDDEAKLPPEVRRGMMAEEMAMERRNETTLEKLLHGRAEGGAVALRGCEEELFAAVRLRFGGDVSRVRFVEPCRVEHPHSAFLRKSVTRAGVTAVQTTLYAPDGRLTEERPQDGPAIEYFVKKEKDFEILRGHLRDVELHAAKPPQGEDALLANAGLTPLRELETRWAGPGMAQWALLSQDESAASCLRKLERQFHRRCEEAEKMGCRAGVLRDMSAEPLPETYMLHAGRHIEWMRHAGLFPWVEARQPEPNLLAALNAAHAGARFALGNTVLPWEGFTLPEGMRLILDASAGDDSDAGLAGELVKKCEATVVLLDCFGARQENVFRQLENFIRVLSF